jgi:hypothetical protein
MFFQHHNLSPVFSIAMFTARRSSTSKDKDRVKDPPPDKTSLAEVEGSTPAVLSSTKGRAPQDLQARRNTAVEEFDAIHMAGQLHTTAGCDMPLQEEPDVQDELSLPTEGSAAGEEIGVEGTKVKKRKGIEKFWGYFRWGGGGGQL